MYVCTYTKYNIIHTYVLCEVPVCTFYLHTYVHMYVCVCQHTYVCVYYFAWLPYWVVVVHREILLESTELNPQQLKGELTTLTYSYCCLVRTYVCILIIYAYVRMYILQYMWSHR